MEQYKGAVLYVDILGISNLTRKKVDLHQEDYEAWGITDRSKWNEHFFCAFLLSAFRSCLKQTKKKYPSIQISQLSDCAFIWSRDVVSVAKAAQYLMSILVKTGVLCRGGIAYGDIIEPGKVAKSLGQFILGEAVTMAVEYEGKGKGCRLFTGPDLVLNLTCARPLSNRYPVESFVGLQNPMTGETVDEFRWYFQTLSEESVFDEEARHLQLLDLIAGLMSSPRFRWNATSEAGKLQLACSIASLSAATREYVPSSVNVFSVDQIMASAMRRDTSIQQKLLKTWSGQAAQYFTSKRTKQSIL
ncbi:hypothetical protein [Pseudomonas prosekii]|uniref:hypothetical protein n=1 Tax=Pseudomonas prosekii TaxID=1148509 RepID=UPI00387B95EE